MEPIKPNTKEFKKLITNFQEMLADEPIVGAFGLPKNRIFKSIKGDPTLKETVLIRNKHEMFLDTHGVEVLNTCRHILKNTGCFSMYLGFNNNEIRTESIFDPFNYEVHEAEKMLDPHYIERHFTPVPFKEKMESISDLRQIILKSKVGKYVPEHWNDLLKNHRKEISVFNEELIDDIVDAFIQLRKVDEFYLRTAAISLGQGTVRTSYNCDGMYYVKAEHFPEFVAETVSDYKPRTKKCAP